jgi:hypothetical protein
VQFADQRFGLQIVQFKVHNRNIGPTAETSRKAVQCPIDRALHDTRKLLRPTHVLLE